MVEKMKLVRVQGTMPQLNEFIGSCCMDGRFDLEPATRYMSESLGYGALNEENPHTAIRDQIETMAKEANMELHEGQQHSDPVDAEGRSYLSDLLEKIDDLCAERKVLLDQKKLCEDGIEQYSHFTGLKVNVDDILDCAHVKIRFGFLPTGGLQQADEQLRRRPVHPVHPLQPDEGRLLGRLHDPAGARAGDRRHLLDALL